MSRFESTPIGTPQKLLRHGARHTGALGAREQDAHRVFAVDSIPERLQLAQRFGTEPLSLSADVVATVRGLTDGRGADGVLKVVGGPEASRLAFDLGASG